MIKQIKFVSIPVEDQDRALDFYTEKLGFTIITDQPFDEKQRWIELRFQKRRHAWFCLPPMKTSDASGHS
jgi:catechol 2,3-dioxygenase-like lactoylglutathione lyase family enzyme